MSDPSLPIPRPRTDREVSQSMHLSLKARLQHTLHINTSNIPSGNFSLDKAKTLLFVFSAEMAAHPQQGRQAKVLDEHLVAAYTIIFECRYLFVWYVTLVVNVIAKLAWKVEEAKRSIVHHAGYVVIYCDAADSHEVGYGFWWTPSR